MFIFLSIKLVKINSSALARDSPMHIRDPNPKGIQFFGGLVA
jgi:hypothetical protein